MTESVKVPFLDLRLREDAAAVARGDRRASRPGAGTSLARKSKRSSQSSPPPAARAFAVGTGTGTDAIALLLRAAGVGAGDEVIVPAITAAYTALAVIAVGATPVIVDVDDETLTMDPCGLRGGGDAANARHRAGASLRTGR